MIKSFNRSSKFLIRGLYTLLIWCFIILLASCNRKAGISSAEQYNQRLNQLKETWGFSMADPPPDWGPIVSPGGNCVFGWSNDKEAILMYIYQFMDANFVLKDISHAFVVSSDVQMENYTTFATSITGFNGKLFLKYVVIPTQTGQHTFSFSYMEKIPNREFSERLNYSDIERFTSQSTSLEVFNRLIQSFSFTTSDLMIQNGLRDETRLKNKPK